jgi:glutamate racemase
MNRKQIIVALIFLSTSCITNTNQKVDNALHLPIEQSILFDENSFYFIDFKSYPTKNPSLPIGVFDSGTGGLTILNTILEFNKYRNGTSLQEQDSFPDFIDEKFIYLADQANMPYGNYYKEEKSDLLVEHILKDAQFLLSNKYYTHEESLLYETTKEQVKILVVACNTATAYGKEHIENFIKRAGLDIKVIGVIDAGARGALNVFGNEEDGSIGVFATVGTIASKGYENTILKLKEELGHKGKIQIFNQGGYGVAEAVDEEPDFIKTSSRLPRETYRGPSLDHPDFKIEKALWEVYNFNKNDDQLLCDANQVDDCQIIQLNSTENYVRYHLVSLFEKIRSTPDAQPLKALLLGCTHYPYLTKEIQTVLKELYNYKKEGKFIYRHLMTENITIIDPALNVAQELYEFMLKENFFNKNGNMKESEFYITVPNVDNNNIKTEGLSRFTYDYKYGRNAGEIQEYVKTVPFSNNNISVETLNRLKESVPTAFKMIRYFHQNNLKTTRLAEELKIK